MMAQICSAFSSSHIPVMLDEVISSLNIKDDGIYVDATFGAGGYSRAILEQSPKVKLIAIDRDPDVLESANLLKQEFDERFDFIAGRFAQIKEHVKKLGLDKVDGVVLDIGVSSMQLDEADRGFSFQKSGPLDMRMSKSGESAEDVVNNMDEELLADVIYQFGEERKSRRIAKAITMARKESRISTTTELAEIVISAIGNATPKGKHPATRTFQALRIYVNGELEELEKALSGAIEILDDGGILVVVTFHSLEDRMVKEFMKKKSGYKQGESRHMPFNHLADDDRAQKAEFSIVRPFPQKPKSKEVDDNPRARSANMRVIRKGNSS